MAIGCEDVSVRMVDLLYGEVRADERATLEAHLGGCARCRAELAALQATRAAARRTLDDDAPPARAHQAILRAAAAAIAAKEAQPIDARPAPQRRSLWERLRMRWTLPTFATVGAVAVVVLASKVFLEPEKTVELGRQTLHPPPVEAPAVPAAVPQPETPEAAKAEPPAEKRERSRDDVELAKQPAADKPLTRSTAAPARERKHAAASEGLGGLGFAKGAAPPAPKKASGDYLDGLLDESDRASPSPKRSKREFAAPPPPRAEPPRAPAPAGAAGKQSLDDELSANAGPPPARAGGGRLQGGSGAAAPPVHVAAKAKKASVSDDAFADPPAASASAPAPAPPPPAPAPPAADREAQKESKRADSKAAESRPAVESPVAHADRLFAEGRWAEAARAYRELLRRDPRNADAARWRQRMAAAEAESAPPAPPAATAPAL